MAANGEKTRKSPLPMTPFLLLVAPALAGADAAVDAAPTSAVAAALDTA